MRFTAIGGGNEIGASCYVLQSAGKRLVVDCGLRFRNRGGNRTEPPKLNSLRGKRVDAILDTHPHLDHSGAMPILAAQHPEAKIWATTPTIKIAELMLKDTIKIAERNGQTPHFSWDDLDQFLNRVTPVESPEWFSPWEGWRIRFWPAGHMRGAASIHIESPEGNALHSGDTSFYNTAIVKGARFPEGFRPRLLITEATNGDVGLPDRDAEVARMIAKVKEVNARGGNALIPAFASERGPSIALELAAAGIKVLTGGMVNDVLDICREYRWCDNDTEIPISDPNIVPISPQVAREIRNASAVNPRAPVNVVTTSGMLVAGLSRTLAFHWIENPGNAILIPGYQAEDVFGRQLLNVERGSFLEFPEREAKRQVLAEVERFHFSGHASGQQLASWITALSPEAVIMVHGERTSFGGLKNLLKTTGFNKRILVGKNNQKIWC